MIGIIQTGSWNLDTIFVLYFLSFTDNSIFFFFRFLFFLLFYHFNQGVSFIVIANGLFESYLCGIEELMFELFVIKIESAMVGVV